MGKYRNRISGEKCEKCKVGFIERIVIQPTAGESIFCLVTLGLGGDGGSQHFKCSNCHTEYDNTIYDETLAEDKPYTVKDYIVIIKFIGVIFITMAIALTILGIIGVLIGVVLGAVS